MDADGLYGLPLDEFVAERGALAKALRADGKRDEAKDVSALRKPSVAAWAVNQLVRTQAKAFDRLLAAGDRLVEVQAGVLAGDREPAELREASASQREAVDQLLEAAGGLLSSGGHELSPAVRDRVADTLQAAALDPEAREQVRGGRLERELRHVGLGAGGLAPGGSHPKSESKTKAKPRPAERKSAAGKGARPGDAEQARRANRAKPAKSAEAGEDKAASRADAKRAEHERLQARRTARHAEADTRRAAERAQRGLEVAQERRDKAAEALAAADRAVAEAERTAGRTAGAHQEAQQALEAL